MDLYICVCCLSLWVCAHKCWYPWEVRHCDPPGSKVTGYCEPHDTGKLLSARTAEPSPHTLLLQFSYDNKCFGYPEHLFGIYLEAQHVLVTMKMHWFLCSTNLNGDLQTAWYRILTGLSCLGRDKALEHLLGVACDVFSGEFLIDLKVVTLTPQSTLML